MKYIHTKCGGRVRVLTGRCTGCKKRWNPISFLLTNDIRPVREDRLPGKQAKDTVRKVTPVKGTAWAASYPGVSRFVGLLPNWPRRTRVLSTVIAVGGMVTLILWLTGVL